MEESQTYTVFAQDKLIASGDLPTVLRRTKEFLDRDERNQVLIFADATGRQVDFDFRGTVEEVIARAMPEKKAGPGRPKLGVVSREVTLLPRHWEWLEQQRQGISGALRRLVDEARKRDPAGEKDRLARDAASRFMWAVAGNLPDFEEAMRALFAKEDARLKELMRGWPKDFRELVLRLISKDEG